VKLDGPRKGLYRVADVEALTLDHALVTEGWSALLGGGHAVAVAATRLGPVHGRVGAGPQFGDVDAVAGELRHTGAEAQVVLSRAELEHADRHPQTSEYRLGHLRGRVRQAERELVASETATEVARPHPVRQPLGHAPEDLVAHRMTEEVVDLLEQIDIEDYERDRVAPPLGPCELGLERLGERQAVQQPGERVVQSEALEPRLPRLDAVQLLGQRDVLGRQSASIEVGRFCVAGPGHQVVTH
jgi:hypothetical protein